MKVVITHILFFIFLSLNLIQAQDAKYLNKSDGLPSNTVYHIVQSSDYYLWITTEMGVTRYDGAIIKNYDRSNGLNSNDNFELVKKNQEIIVLGSNGTLSAINSSNSKREKIFSQLKFNSFVSEYFESENGRIVASSFGDGIKIINPSGDLKHYTKKSGLLDDYVSFVWESDNFIYLLSKDGISKIDSKNKITVIHKFNSDIHFSRAVKNKLGEVLFTARNEVYVLKRNENLVKLNNGDLITSKTPTKLQITDNGYVASTYHGAYFFDIDEGRIEISQKYLDNEEVTSVCIDHENNYWFSTLNSGIVRLDNERIDLLSINERVNCLATGPDGKIMFGLNNLGYGQINNNSIEYSVLTAKNKYSTHKVNGISFFDSKTWFEVDGGIASLDKGEIKYYRTGRATLIQYNGALFVGNKQGCFKINTVKDFEVLKEDGINESLINTKFKKLVEGSIQFFKIFEGNLYIGTNHGLYVLKNNSLKRCFNWDSKEVILDVYIKGKEAIVCLEEKGIVYINGNRTKRIDKSNGLSSDYCYKVDVVAGTIVLATSDGINLVKKHSVFEQKLQTKMIFKGKTVYDFLIVDQNLYAATNTGVYRVNDFRIESEKRKIPLQKTNIYVNNILRTQGEIQGLSYSENNLTFDFNYILLSNSKAAKYYRLNGGIWKIFEGQLQFDEMSPSSYVLELKVESEGDQSEIKKYEFTINVPWWSTWWFRVTMLLFIFLLIYWFFKVRILTYNRDIVRELLQVILNKLKKEKYIIVKNIKDGSKTKIVLSQFLYAESSKNYITLFRLNDKVIVRSTMKEIHKQISEVSPDFFRCHRSYLINTKKIDAVHTDFFKVADQKIPIGTNYLNTAHEKMELLKRGRN